MKPKKLKQCKGADCEQLFRPFTSLQKYCSPQCAPKGKKRKVALVDGMVVCSGRGCRVEFKPKSKRNRYCSPECRPKYGQKYKIGKTTVDGKWSRVIRLMADNKCEYCGSTEGLSAHHIIARSNHAVRWNLDNGVCLCSLHHTFSSDFSAHLNPIEFALWMTNHWGIIWWNGLKIEASFPDGMNRDDANTMLTNKLKELQSGR